MKAHESEITSPTTNPPADGPPRTRELNRASAIVVMLLSLIALLTVLSGYAQPPHPPDPDEGTAAHIFQLSIALLVPALLLFLATADWKQPWRSARPLAFPAAALVIAFGMLYYLEHYYR
jgi:hypothetical protein